MLYELQDSHKQPVVIYQSKRLHQDLLKLLLIIYTCLSIPKSL